MGVYHAGIDDSRKHRADAGIAGRDDFVWISVKHLLVWLNDPKNKDRLPRDASIETLIPFINDVPLKGIYPQNYWVERQVYNGIDEPDADSSANPQIHNLKFWLARTDVSKDAWSEILDRPIFSRPAKISVGFENGVEMPTFIKPNAPNTANEFNLTVIPELRFWLGVILIVGAFIVFLYLARSTDIIRDPDAPLRPDKRWPYSLSRTQMAFWFFLTIGSYFFLWVIIGDMDTLNSSIVALLGISATTTFAAVLVDAGKPSATGSDSDLPAVNLSQSRKKIQAEIRDLIKTMADELEQLEKERGNINPSDVDGLKANAEAQAAKQKQRDDLQRQLEYFQWPAWRGLLYDLLTEKGDPKKTVVSFQRFQILVWTLVLGLMFVANVYTKLAMPQFSATLLGLLGVSAGSYVSGKITTTNAAKNSA